jgi:hypothetical protein
MVVFPQVIHIVRVFSRYHFCQILPRIVDTRQISRKSLQQTMQPLVTFERLLMEETNRTPTETEAAPHRNTPTGTVRSAAALSLRARWKERMKRDSRRQLAAWSIVLGLVAALISQWFTF